MTTDEWVAAALADDSVVVELLFRLKQSSEALALRAAPAPLRWGHRQPRSKPAAAAATRKELEWTTRCSPTTPLSWSCGGDGGDASPSDGCDDSSRPSDRSSGGRSKGCFANETTATANTNKQSRRKKTFAQLQEEESFLLKERMHMKKEIATLCVTLKEQKAQSENLKRLKLDLHLHSANKMAANSSQPNLLEASTLDHVPVSPIAPASCKVEKEVETEERCFMVPDLNMMPAEEDFGCETLYALS